MAVAMIGPKFSAWDRNGKPLAFGKLYTYQARTNTPKETYQSEDQVVANPNPVILNGEGYADVYLSGSYKMVLKDDKDNEIWSSDPVSASQPEEWVHCLTATYLSPTSFEVNGNFTAQYSEGRRVRIDNNTSEYSYSTIISSTFAANKTTVVIVDSVVTTGVLEVCTSIVSPQSTFGGSIINFDTLDSALNSKIIKKNTAITLTENKAGNGGGGIWDVVDESTVTVNGFNIVQSIEQPELALVLRLNKIIGATNLVSYVDPRQIGAEQGEVTDVVAAIIHATSIADVVNGGGCTFAVQGTIELSSFRTLENIKLKLLGDQSDYNIAAVINDDIAGTGNFGVACRKVEVIGFNTTQQDSSTVITPANGGVGGIYLEKCSDSTVEDCKTSDTWSGIVFTGQHASTFVEQANNKCIRNKVERAHSWAATGNTGVPRGIFFGTGGVVSCNYTNDCATGYYLVGDAVTATMNTARNWYIDDGFYILGRDFIVTENRAIGFKGNGFAIAYNEESIISNNYAAGCTNMGFRIHCPQRDTIITSNRAERCGYGYRIENSIDLLPASLTSSGTTATFVTTAPHIMVTGDFVVVEGADQPEYNGLFRVSVPNDTTIVYTMLGTPASSPATGAGIKANYTSQGLTISNNHAVQNDLAGIQLSYLVNSTITENHCVENNKSGVTLGTRGGLSLQSYCHDNLVKNNKCYDYAGVPTQIFGLYNYDASVSGAEAENIGNVFDHKSETGTDYFGAVEYANPRGEIEAGSFVPELTPSGGGTIGYNVQEGRWHRTGNLVTVHMAFQINSVSGLSGVLQVLNMPFTASADINQQTGTMNGYAINHNSGYPNIAPIMLKNSTSMNFYVWDSGTNAVTLDATGLLSSSEIYVTITYWIKN